MNPRPIYRSMSFWLGLPGLLFLLWTWRDSLTHVAGIHRSVTIECLESISGATDFIGYRSGGFWVIVNTMEPHPEASEPRSIHRGPIEVDHDELLEGLTGNQASPRLHWRSPDPDFERGNVGITGFVLPHWLALILYLVAWGAVMTWRQKRSHRMERQLLTGA